MAVRPIKYMPGTEKISKRLDVLKGDVREIIDKRIPICEITDIPYPENSIRSRMEKAIRNVVWEISRKDGSLRVPVDTFKLMKRTVNGESHWFIRFDVDRWESEWSPIDRPKN